MLTQKKKMYKIFQRQRVMYNSIQGNVAYNRVNLKLTFLSFIWVIFSTHTPLTIFKSFDKYDILKQWNIIQPLEVGLHLLRHKGIHSHYYVEKNKWYNNLQSQFWQNTIKLCVYICVQVYTYMWLSLCMSIYVCVCANWEISQLVNSNFTTFTLGEWCPCGVVNGIAFIFNWLNGYEGI